MTRLKERPCPFPKGWFVVGYSRDLSTGSHQNLTFMGQELVMFRTQSGKPALLDAYCSHLGAHIGHGGQVVGEAIRCPFHGFCFDSKGDCVKIEYDCKIPPKARQRAWPIVERYGILFAWHDPLQQSPGWELPAEDQADWSPLLYHNWQIPSCPQEIAENSVDIGHLRVVHGYDALEIVKPIKTDGPLLTASYSMERSAAVMGRFGKTMKVIFDIYQYGLGLAIVEASIPEFEIRSRHFVMPSPIDGKEIKLHIALSMNEKTRPAKINPLLALLPRALVNRIMLHATFKGYKHDVMQDFIIWKNKTYISRPALAAGDGPVGQYRLWTRQFDTDIPLRLLSPEEMLEQMSSQTVSEDIK